MTPTSKQQPTTQQQHKYNNKITAAHQPDKEQ